MIASNEDTIRALATYATACYQNFLVTGEDFFDIELSEGKRLEVEVTEAVIVMELWDSEGCAGLWNFVPKKPLR